MAWRRNLLRSAQALMPPAMVLWQERRASLSCHDVPVTSPYVPVKRSLSEANRGKSPQGPINHGQVKIFTGNAHPQLAIDISECIGVPLSKATVGRFNCGEVHVQINESVRDCDVFIVQSTCNGGGGPQEHMVELLMMIDAIRRGAANRITAVMPLFGYARQNAKAQTGAPISAKLVTDMLNVAGADRVLTVELHSGQIQGFAKYPMDNMYALPLFSNELQNIILERGLSSEDIVVVSPDVGGAKRASALAKKLCAPLAVFSRQRRRLTEAAEIDIVGDVDGKTCIVLDDIADNAETVCKAADRLKEEGAKAVIAAIVHGVLSHPACDSINASQLELVLVSDTIPLDDKTARCPKLKVVSVAPLLGAAILRIHKSESLSALFISLPATVSSEN